MFNEHLNVNMDQSEDIKNTAELIQSKDPLGFETDEIAIALPKDL